VLAPDPLRVIGVPLQLVWFGPPLTVGSVFTTTFTDEEVTEHPAPLVTVTVYVPLELTDRLGVLAPFDHK